MIKTSNERRRRRRTFVKNWIELNWSTTTDHLSTRNITSYNIKKPVGWIESSVSSTGGPVFSAVFFDWKMTKINVPWIGPKQPDRWTFHFSVCVFLNHSFYMKQKPEWNMGGKTGPPQNEWVREFWSGQLYRIRSPGFLTRNSVLLFKSKKKVSHFLVIRFWLIFNLFAFCCSGCCSIFIHHEIEYPASNSNERDNVF